jgi:tetratricopeptide (TPR) repeat protein
MKTYRLWLTCVVLVLASLTMSAQGFSAPTPTPDPASTPLPLLPTSWRLNNVRYEAQGWNNCGPATLTNALSYFGYQNDQKRAANWLKPNYEDKNVSAWQMAEFVNTQVPELDVYALVRYGGTLNLLKRLLANNFPVIIEKGYDPEPNRLGWMGHYLLLVGYDDSKQAFITHDSYIGANTPYTYEYVQNYWQHFNYLYMPLYTRAREADLQAILGEDYDERNNVIRALQIARSEASANPQDKFAWFNMGTNFTLLGMYPEASIAYDEARKYNLPYRMLWYQFGIFEAYYHVGRYDDMIAFAQANLNDGGGQYVEETYYYAALARYGKGERERALNNLNAALQFNPNFTPAKDAKKTLFGQ